jgi:Na+/glutamate symporter
MDRVGASGYSNNAWKDYYKVSKENGNKWGKAKGVGGITTNVLGSQFGQLIGNAIGTGLSVWGSKVAATDQTAGAAISSTGTAVTSAMTITKAVASMGGALGAAAGPIGLVAGALIGIVSFLVSIPSKLEKAQEDLANAQKEAEEANIKRAEAQKEAKDLDNTISKLKELQRVRYRSQEAEKEYMDACTAAAE